MSVRSSVTALALATVMLVPVVAAAQTSTVGIKGGLNFSTLKADDVSDIKSLRGLTGGIFVSREINKNFGLQFEALYSQKGAKSDEGTGDVRIRINYIDIPVLARFGPTSTSGNHFHFFTGVTASLKLSSELSIEGSSVTEDLDEDLKSSDFGVTFGAEADINRFVIDARYTHGLTNIDKSDSTVKNRTFSITVGVRLR